MGVIVKERWKNNRNVYKNFMDKTAQYIEQKKTPVIGVNIDNKTILKFNTICDAENSGFSVSQNLTRQTQHAKRHLWFYDEGFSDEFYVEVAEIQLGSFGVYKKNNTSWADPEHKAMRVSKMIEGSKHRAKPLIAKHSQTGEILEFLSMNQAGKLGFNNLSTVMKTTKTAYGYIWYFKDEIISLN